MSENHFHVITPVFLCADLPATIRFYVDKLGFHEDFQWPDPPTYAGVSRGHCALHLFGCPTPARSNSVAWEDYGSPADAGLYISDADALYAEFTARGVVPDGPPETQPYGIRSFDVRDPNGYVLRFNAILDPHDHE